MIPSDAIEPPFNSPEERADAWARALHWGTPEQLRARGIEPPFVSRTDAREPSCIHSNGTQPMNACEVCRDSAEYRAWLDYWRERNA